MVYYLGRDVKVYIATESSATHSLYVHDTDLTLNSASGTKFAQQRGDPMHASGQVTDLTGVDLGIGAVDEDITFMGLRSILKAEIKKETTLTITKKKLDAVYDVIFNGDGTNSGRWGISGEVTAGSTANVYTGLEKPTVNYGYRIHIQLKSSGEIFCIRNATIVGHTVSLNSDGVTEETLEFQSHVDPKIVTSAHSTVTGSTEI
tara:strand:- start:233 stop:844 length:612 start_codon:yes stop_codon:yes gene_type:complete